MKALAAAALLALLSLAGCADEVGTRIYAHNATDEPAEVLVRVRSPDGEVVVEESAILRAGEGDVLVGHIDGPPGNYSWWVSFGPRTYQTTGWFDDGLSAMNLNLLSDRLEITFAPPL